MTDPDMIYANEEIWQKKVKNEYMKLDKKQREAIGMPYVEESEDRGRDPLYQALASHVSKKGCRLSCEKTDKGLKIYRANKPCDHCSHHVNKICTSKYYYLNRESEKYLKEKKKEAEDPKTVLRLVTVGHYAVKAEDKIADDFTLLAGPYKEDWEDIKWDNRWVKSDNKLPLHGSYQNILTNFYNGIYEAYKARCEDYHQHEYRHLPLLNLKESAVIWIRQNVPEEVLGTQFAAVSDPLAAMTSKNNVGDYNENSDDGDREKSEESDAKYGKYVDEISISFDNYKCPIKWSLNDNTVLAILYCAVTINRYVHYSDTDENKTQKDKYPDRIYDELFLDWRKEKKGNDVREKTLKRDKKKAEKLLKDIGGKCAQADCDKVNEKYPTQQILCVYRKLMETAESNETFTKFANERGLWEAIDTLGGLTE